jgi:hypothetical protein
MRLDGGVTTGAIGAMARATGAASYRLLDAYGISGRCVGARTKDSMGPNTNGSSHRATNSSHLKSSNSMVSLILFELMLVLSS